MRNWDKKVSGAKKGGAVSEINKSRGSHYRNVSQSTVEMYQNVAKCGKKYRNILAQLFRKTFQENIADISCLVVVIHVDCD